MMNCDTLLMLGTDFPYQQFYPETATNAQIDNQPEQIGRRTRVNIGLVVDVKATLQALVPKLDSKVQHYQEARRRLDDLATEVPGKKPIHPQFVAKVLNKLASEDAIFSCNVGTPTIWATRYFEMNGKRRLLGSFNHGSMASALPQAIGAQLTFPGRQVITLSGDGGLAMLMGDILSLKQLDFPVKIVVFNNGSLGFVELEMKAAGFLDYRTELHNPNFAKVAKAIGLLGIRIEYPEDLVDGLK